jgi:uncharacterized protein (DUF1697 family)
MTMSNHVALLRGINVGGHNKISMSDLRNLFEILGFSEVQSLLQSGNVVFESRQLKGPALERSLEIETAKRLGVSVDYLVRSAKELRTIIEDNPFEDEARRDPSHLLVMFLKTAVKSAEVSALEAAVQGREIIHADGKQLYAVYPDGIGRSKLTNTLIEKKLGTRGTARNWNTVLKLAAMMA